MKVAFITPYYPSISVTGGGLYAEHLAKELSKHVDIDVFLPSINEEKLDDELKYITIDVPQKPISRTINFLYNVKNELVEEDYDIIHVNEAGGLFLENVDVLTVHHPPENIEKRMNLIPVYLEAIKAKKIITVSKKSKDELLKDSLFWNKDIDVVPNGINPIFLKERNDEKLKSLREKYDISEEKVVLYINSNFTERKNLPLMIETVKYLKSELDDIRFIMICKEKYKEKVKKKFEKEDIEDISEIACNLSDKELVYHYTLADLLAMPSTREGFGFPMIEALATGTYFVSFDVGVGSELEGNGYGKIAIDDQDFKEKCLHILDTYVKYDDSKKFVKKNYSWKNSAKRLYKLYEHIHN